MMRVQFTRDTLGLIRQILPVGIDGCRGVFATPDLGEWWDDPKKVWPDDADMAAILLPDGRLLGVGGTRCSVRTVRRTRRVRFGRNARGPVTVKVFRQKR